MIYENGFINYEELIHNLTNNGEKFNEAESEELKKFLKRFLVNEEKVDFNIISKLLAN